jgi:Flp pilus assembly protein TadG
MKRKTQAGATAVEFALILIIFLTFLLGVVDFSRMLWTWNAATEATRWGARVAVVCDQGSAAVLANMSKIVPQLTAAKVQIDWYDSSGSISTTCDHTNCAGVNVWITGLDYQWMSPIAFAARPVISMPSFSTYLPREVMGQDPNSAAVCS